MYPCLALVRREIRQLVTRLLKEIPNLRIGVISHTDYSNHVGPDEIIRMRDLTNNVNELCDFVENVKGPIGNNGTGRDE